VTTSQLLDDRYGRGSARRSTRIAWIVVGVVAVASVAALGWTTVSNTVNTVDVDVTRFTAVDERAVELDFQVIAPAGSRVACALEAQDEEHGVVGWRVVEFDVDASRSRVLTETVPTVAPATTGLVNSCWVA
jgi:hypothetical protein